MNSTISVLRQRRLPEAHPDYRWGLQGFVDLVVAAQIIEPFRASFRAGASIEYR